MGSEVNNGNEGEEVTEKIDEIGDEIKIVIENNGIQRCLLGNKFINIFRKIENDDDHDQ
jgi:hypothetical protein